MMREDGVFDLFAPRSASAPASPADAFARVLVSAICRASVTPSVGRQTYERCLRALEMGATARVGFRHPGKAEAIDLIWRRREQIHRDYQASADKLAFLETLPWIGPVTRRALARDLGLISPLAQQTPRAA